MKTAISYAALMLAAAVTGAADISIPELASGEKITVLRIRIGSDEPLASPVVRANGVTDWILAAQIIALNQHGEPISYRNRIDSLLGRVKATHAKCIIAGAALNIDYATATGLARMQCVALAIVTEIGERLVSDAAARSEWISRVYADVLAGMAPQS